MNLTLLEKRELYCFIEQAIDEGAALEEACILYSDKSGLDAEECMNCYTDFKAEVNLAQKRFPSLLKAAIQKSEQKGKELEGKTAPTRRLIEPWEEEILEVGLKAKPEMKKHAYASYLADVLPHRTAKAYTALQSRKERAEKLERMKTLKINEPEVEVDIELTDSTSLSSEPIRTVSLSRHTEGEIVDCTVTKLLSYGVILISDIGEKGLLHISEIRNHHIDNIEDYLVEGQRVKAQVISDPQGRLVFSTRNVIDKTPVLVTPTVDIEVKASPMIKENNTNKNHAVKNKYSMKNITLSELPNIIRGLVKNAEEEKSRVQDNINALQQVLRFIEAENSTMQKINEIKKQLANI